MRVIADDDAAARVDTARSPSPPLSATPGTTDPMAPFGIATLAPSGTEGGSDIGTMRWAQVRGTTVERCGPHVAISPALLRSINGTMRWAQTASYGQAPNAALPNVFVAQVKNA